MYHILNNIPAKLSAIANKMYTGCQEIDVPLLTKPYKFIIKTKKTMSLANVTSLNFDTFLNALGHTTNQVVKNIGRDVCPSRFHIFYQSFPVRRVR